MAKVFIEETTLTAIGDAIREKDGTSDLIPVSDMSSRITAIPSGGGDSGVPDELLFSGDASYAFRGGTWDWIIENYGNRIRTDGLTGTNSMFQYSEVSRIPFALNFASTSYGYDMWYMFQGCKNLTSIPDMTLAPANHHTMGGVFQQCFALTTLPYIYNAYPNNVEGFVYLCQSLRDIPVDYTDTWNFSRLQSYQYADASSIFQGCYSLRRAPTEFLKRCCGIQTYATYGIYGSVFNSCYSLDEIVDLPVLKSTLTSNMFDNSFDWCSRIKNLTFELDPDTNAPYVVQWKGQVIDLTDNVGYCAGFHYPIDYNSGITADKKVTDDATYQALEDDPDWWTSDFRYSRYNHASAVNTINSLPDTSAYLASAGGTNTIKFLGAAGVYTDVYTGGAINTLTEEEIAVATAKGWTVTLV